MFLEMQGGLWGKILMWKGACTVPIYQAPVGHPHTGQILSSPGFSHCSKHRGSLRTRGSKSLWECQRTWGANAGKQASEHQSTRLMETPSLPFPGWCQNFLTPAVFPGTQPAPAGLFPSSSLPHTCSLGPGPGERVIRHMRGTDKTPPEPHRSYPALPSQLFELVGSRQQKEPHPPTPQATVSPAPKGALPGAITPYDVITTSGAVSFSQVQESYAERSQESGIRKMPSPRHQVSSWTGSRGWCHRSLPPGWRAILVLAASHMATPLPVLPIQRGSGFSGSRDRGGALSHHRDVLGISLRSGASPVLPSRLLE